MCLRKRIVCDLASECTDIRSQHRPEGAVEDFCVSGLKAKITCHIRVGCECHACHSAFLQDVCDAVRRASWRFKRKNNKYVLEAVECLPKAQMRVVTLPRGKYLDTFTFV